MEYNVVQVVGKGQRRKILLQANLDLISIISNILRQRERRMLAQIGAAHSVLSRLPTQFGTMEWDEDRLASLGKMIESATGTLDSLIQAGLFLEGALSGIAEPQKS